MTGSKVQTAAYLLVGLMARMASANTLIDNFNEGAVNIQAGPYPDFYQGHWVEALETGLSPTNVIGGTRWTSVFGWYRDWQSAQLTNGAMRFQLDENLTNYDAGLYYGNLGGRVLDGTGIAFDINYDRGGFATAVSVHLALSDTHGRSGTMDILAGQQYGQKGISGTYEFAFDSRISNRVDLMSIDSIGLSLLSGNSPDPFTIDNIRQTPEPGTLIPLALAALGLSRRRRT